MKEVTGIYSVLIHEWKRKLGVTHTVFTQEIEREQVTDASGEIGAEFVGISVNHDNVEATIFHTRNLQDDDVAHELLHIRYPEWEEEQVNRATYILTGIENNSLL